MDRPTPLMSMLEALEPRTFLSSPTAATQHPFSLTAAVSSANANNKKQNQQRKRQAKVVISYRASMLFPMAEGATWTYRSGTEIIDQAVEGTPATVKGVTTAKIVTTRQGELIGESTMTSGANGIRLLQRSMVMPGATDQETYPGGVPVLPFAVRTGAKTAFKIKWQGVADSGGFAWNGNDARKLQVMGFQTITVPAGSFKAMLVRETRTATQSQTQNGPLTVGLKVTTDAWYAPGIGLVRSSVTTRRTAYYNNRAVETSTSKKVTDLLATNLSYVPPRPDLVSATRGQASITARTGSRVTIETVVRNLGQESARPSTVTLYLSNDRTVDFADAAMGAARVKALAPGQSLVRSITLQLPRQPGTYFAATFADAANEVDEPNRVNNWSSPMKIVVNKRA
jgi:hypothetical protein